MIGNQGDEKGPDLIEPVICFRWFRLIFEQDYVWPRGDITPRPPGQDIGVGSLWLPHFWTGATQRAECHRSFHHGSDLEDGLSHSAPHHDCGCGLYGFYDLELQEQFADLVYRSGEDSQRLVPGIISMFGDVEVHPKGCRSSHAKLVALGLPWKHSNTKWGRHLRDATLKVAHDLKVSVTETKLLPEIAGEFGSPMPMEFRPEQPESPWPETPWVVGANWISITTNTSGYVPTTGRLHTGGGPPQTLPVFTSGGIGIGRESVTITNNHTTF